MSARPIIALIGRPNVGKSTLFNRMLRRRNEWHPKKSKDFLRTTAIVEDTPGVTRDRHYGEVVYMDKRFIIVDTGGFIPIPRHTRERLKKSKVFLESEENEILSQIREQTTIAINEADVIISIMDGKEGVTSLDTEVVNMLRLTGKPVIYAINKIDGPTYEKNLYDFYSLGIDEPLPISALHGRGIDDLMERLYSVMPRVETFEETAVSFPKIAVVGKPNVGKSTLINTILGEKRMIISSAPGTTRDSIDTVCNFKCRQYIFIDTAGLRRQSKVAHPVERYSILRTLKSIERADISILLIDAYEGITSQDIRIAGMIHESGKGIIVLLNKWDMVMESAEDYIDKVKRQLYFVDYAPVLNISATTGKNVTRIFRFIDDIIVERKRDILTSEINKVLEDAVSHHHPPLYRGKVIRLKYATQISKEPPTFLIFANYPECIDEAYLRYIERRFRNTFGFKGTPIKIVLRKSERKRGTPKN